MKLKRKARGHFVTLIEVGVRLIECNPGRFGLSSTHNCDYRVNLCVLFHSSIIRVSNTLY